MNRRLLLPVLLTILVAGPSFAAATDTGEGWIRVDTPHLSIFSNAPEATALEVGLKVERFRGLLATITSDHHVHSPLPTFLYVFRDDQSFRPHKPRQPASPGAPINAAGYFVKHRDGNYIGLSADPQADPWPVVYHEYFHYFLDNNFNDIPLWFGEGMAECFSAVRFEKGRVSVGRPLGHHRQWLRTNPLISPDELFAIDTGSRDYNEGVRQGTFYAESWALVHYLLWGRPGASGSGVQFLRELKRGSSLAEALRPLVGADLGLLQARLETYIKEGLRHSELEYESQDSEVSPRATPIGRDEALYRLGDYLLHTDPALAGAAASHLKEALRLNPAHGKAHAALAQVRVDEGRFDEAFAGFETAMRIDPADDWTPLLFAYALLEQAVPDGITRYELTDDPPPQLSRARELFQRSTRRNPDIGEAWAGLGLTYLANRRDVSAGIEALERAHRLLPAREDIVANLATLHTRGGAGDRARELVDTILLRSVDSAIRAAGAEILFRGNLEKAAALIDKGKVEEGMKRLRALRDGTQDPALRSEADAYLRALEDTASKNRQVALYNAAIDRANRQDLPGAIARLEQFLSDASDPKLKKEAETLLGKLRQIAIYNRAVGQVNAGDPAGAAALLREILRDPHDPDTARRARELLTEIETRTPPGS